MSNNDNATGQFMITCPYCYEIFGHKEVCFRSKTVFRNEDELIKEVTTGECKSKSDLDQSNNDIFKNMVEKRQPFIVHGKSDKFRNFWKSYKNGDRPESANKERLAQEIDYEYNRPLLDPADRNVTKELHYDEDGFLSAITDVFDKMTRARVCPKCNNPLPQNYGRYPVKHISVVGIKGSGKTVFLSQFLKYLVLECSRVGIATGVQDPTIQKYIEENPVLEGEYLSESTEPTALISPLSINLTINNKNYTFVFHDIAGENCVSPSQMIHFTRFIEHSDALIFIIDPKQIDAFGIPRDTDDVIDLGTVFTTIGNTFGNHIHDVPAAVVISQLDRNECKNVMQNNCPILYQNQITPVTDNPLTAMRKPKFNGREYNSIYDYLSVFLCSEPTIVNVQNNFPNHSYFGISAIGVAVENAVPVGIPVPYRVSEPFFWILYKLGLLDSSEEVHELISEEQFQEKVIEDAIKSGINLNAARGFFRRTVHKTPYGTVSASDKSKLDNIESNLRQKYITY